MANVTLNPPLVTTDLSQSRPRAPDWRTQERLIIAGLLVIDMITLAVAFLLALAARFNNPWLPYFGEFALSTYTRLILWGIPLYMLIFAIHRLYDPHTLFCGTSEYARVGNACTFGIVAVIVLGFFERNPSYEVSRGWLVAAWLLSILAVGGGRFVFRRIVHHLRWKGLLLARAVVLGTNEEAKAVAEQLRSNPGGGLQLIGFVGDHYEPGTHVLDGLRVLGSTADLSHLVRDHDIHEVIVAPTSVTREHLLDVHRTLSNFPHVHLRLSSGLYEILTTGVEIYDVGNVPLISLNRLRLSQFEAVLKSCLDYGLAIPGIIIVSPLLLLIAILVRCSSPGPIIYHRRVLGVGGKPFGAYKFRTMVVNADRVLADMLEKDPELRREYESGQKLKNDPRVTRLGRFLRRYSLDELPQVFNVLKGEMSLVGPRMISPEEAARYGKWSMNLLTVKPGITGPWQVMGRNDLPYDERVRLSMQYIRNYSIWTDIKLLYQTFMVVIKGKGAY